MPDVERFTTVLLLDGSTLRCKPRSVKIRRGLVRCTGIAGTKMVFALTLLARIETPA